MFNCERPMITLMKKDSIKRVFLFILKDDIAKLSKY